MTGKPRYTAFLRQLLPDGTSQQQSTCLPLSGSSIVTIGRDPRCQIALSSDRYRSVSRRHVEISPVVGFESSDGSSFWQVCDLNSANGTFLNGKRLQGCQVLQGGDRFMLGQQGPEFAFEYHAVTDPFKIQGLEDSTDFSLPGAIDPTDRLVLHPLPAIEPEQASLTQLFPILSTGQHLIRKAYLLPAGITIGVVVSLFLAVGQASVFNFLLAAYLAGAVYYFVYQLCGKHKPWWVLFGTALLMVLLLTSPLLNLFLYIFRQVLPGNLPTDITGLDPLTLLIRMFFGAGLMEELLKALPVLLACFLGKCLRSPKREEIGVWEPLDGILLGAASAVGFTLAETLGQYIPGIYQSTLAAGEGAAQLASLQLLIPRVLGSVAGHIAYSGYLGYFVGLSVLRSRRSYLIQGIGYLSASGLHALWNAAGMISPVLLAVVGILSYAFLGSAILKAREVSPTRSQNFATRFYQ
ncbi:PrsW family glutamic-type intramembrane protease [Pantanalinema rosaneae CENA516]|uniref:PrsW family glutamic-type intramembrane protease n=1 Tax=Pantanalinema rosaneae TaxID=1620701 RepID=UPI003D6F832E